MKRYIIVTAILSALFTVALSKAVDAGPQLLAAHVGALAAKSKTIVTNVHKSRID